MKEAAFKKMVTLIPKLNLPQPEAGEVIAALEKGDKAAIKTTLMKAVLKKLKMMVADHVGLFNLSCSMETAVADCLKDDTKCGKVVDEAFVEIMDKGLSVLCAPLAAFPVVGAALEYLIKFVVREKMMSSFEAKRAAEEAKAKEEAKE